MLEAKFNEKLEQDGTSLTPQECAGVILRVLQEPQWGRGSIVEATKAASEKGSQVTVRDVRLEALYPSAPAISGLGARVTAGKRRLIAHLQEKGLKPSVL